MDAVALLRAMETACRGAAASLPQTVEPREVWSGIAFRLGDRPLLVPMGEVTETLPVPQLIAVPNTPDWVFGIANVRGRLLSVFDLRGLLYGAVAQTGYRSRVLVIDFEDIYSGLIVDEVYGLRHFPVDAYVSAGDRMDDVLKPYVRDGIQDEDTFRGIFDIYTLADSARFMQVAV